MSFLSPMSTMAQDTDTEGVLELITVDQNGDPVTGAVFELTKVEEDQSDGEDITDEGDVVDADDADLSDLLDATDVIEDLTDVEDLDDLADFTDTIGDLDVDLDLDLDTDVVDTDVDADTSVDVDTDVVDTGDLDVDVDLDTDTDVVDTDVDADTSVDVDVDVDTDTDTTVDVDTDITDTGDIDVDVDTDLDTDVADTDVDADTSVDVDVDVDTDSTDVIVGTPIVQSAPSNADFASSGKVMAFAQGAGDEPTLSDGNQLIYVVDAGTYLVTEVVAPDSCALVDPFFAEVNTAMLTSVVVSHNCELAVGGDGGADGVGGGGAAGGGGGQGTGGSGAKVTKLPSTGQGELEENGLGTPMTMILGTLAAMLAAAGWLQLRSKESEQS